MIDSSASSSIQEDSGRDSVDSKKILPPKIPKVKFTCDGDSSTSPADSVSVSPSDSVEYVSFCNYFFVEFLKILHFLIKIYLHEIS